MESTTAGLQKDKAKNEMKDSTIEELNEMVCRITEEMTGYHPRAAG